MTEQEEKQTSIEYLLNIIDYLIKADVPFDFFIFNEISINAKAKYENELVKSFEEGMKYADGIINDERFPF
jgi:hypothetical protein